MNHGMRDRVENDFDLPIDIYVQSACAYPELDVTVAPLQTSGHKQS